jgi:hexosaminidase
MQLRGFASFILTVSMAGAAGAQQIALMPMPASIQRQNGDFIVTPAHGGSALTLRYTASHDDRLETAAMRMVRQFDHTCGGQVRESILNGTPSDEGSLDIDVVGPGEKIQGLDEDESYSLVVTPASVKLTAATDVGAMHGMQTLLQLASFEGGACVLPAVTIQDSPRFRWRGLMIDSSRHFEPVFVIERTLDGMSVAKLNVFHWHLSDDQGWRAQSLKYPKLTEVASDGQFYTQDQMREVVAYARARGIRVVPEFDVPGHSSAAILAYPDLGSEAPLQALPIVYGTPAGELDPTNEKVYKFVDAIVGEMGKIFPDQYFHIGGDEVQGKHWMADPKIRAFMAKKGFTTPAQLQAYFNQRLLKILDKHHKTMIGWDEILQPDLPKTIVIQSWRGSASLAKGAGMGFQGILSAPYYLDGQKTSGQMFLADPIPADTALTPDQQKLILGGETCMWAEQIDPETVDSRIWPRTLAIAERFWSPQGDRDVPFMYERLRKVSLELEDVGLTHISGPEKLRRNLAGKADPAALDLLASVTEPVTFGRRYHGQKTNGYTSLDRLVDAVVADPPSRQRIAGDVDAVTAKMKLEMPEAGAQAKGDDPDIHTDAGTVPEGFRPARGPAAEDLRKQFLAWQRVPPALLELSTETPRLNDTAPLALDLGELGSVGMEALAYVDAKTPAPAEWVQHADSVLANAQKGAALVHFTFLPSLQKLVIAAGQATPR